MSKIGKNNIQLEEKKDIQQSDLEQLNSFDEIIDFSEEIENYV